MEGTTVFQSILYVFTVLGLGAFIGIGTVIGAVVYLSKRVQKAGR